MIKLEFTNKEVGIITTVLWQFKSDVKIATDDGIQSVELLKELNIILQKFQDATLKNALETAKKE